VLEDPPEEPDVELLPVEVELVEPTPCEAEVVDGWLAVDELTLGDGPEALRISK